MRFVCPCCEDPRVLSQVFWCERRRVSVYGAIAIPGRMLDDRGGITRDVLRQAGFCWRTMNEQAGFPWQESMWLSPDRTVISGAHVLTSPDLGGVTEREMACLEDSLASTVPVLRGALVDRGLRSGDVGSVLSAAVMLMRTFDYHVLGGYRVPLALAYVGDESGLGLQPHYPLPKCPQWDVSQLRSCIDGDREVVARANSITSEALRNEWRYKLRRTLRTLCDLLWRKNDKDLRAAISEVYAVMLEMLTLAVQ